MGQTITRNPLPILSAMKRLGVSADLYRVTFDGLAYFSYLIVDHWQQKSFLRLDDEECPALGGYVSDCLKLVDRASGEGFNTYAVNIGWRCLESDIQHTMPAFYVEVKYVSVPTLENLESTKPPMFGKVTQIDPHP